MFGKNPISDEGESPASALIGAFMELIGQKEIWENIKKGNAVAKAWAWFQGAMKGALALVTSIPGRVMGVIQTAFSASQVLGLPAGLYASNPLGWHSPFLFLSGVVLLLGAGVALGLRPLTGHLTGRVDRHPFHHLIETLSTPLYLQAFATTLAPLCGPMRVS